MRALNDDAMHGIAVLAFGSVVRSTVRVSKVTRATSGIEAWKWPLWPITAALLLVNVATLTANVAGWLGIELGYVIVVTLWAWVIASHWIGPRLRRATR